QGDIIYYNGSSWTTITAGTNGNFLRTNGAGAAPSWQTATGTTYSAAAAPNLLQLVGTEFSLKQNTMTDTRLCVYSSTLGLVCDTPTSSVGHTAATINATTPNGLSLATQELSLALSSTSTTGALSSTDWNIFSNKQDAGAYLTSFTEVDPRLPAIGTTGNLLQSNGTAWSSWTPNYLSANQTITLSGDTSGSGTTSITTTIGADKITESMLVASATPASGNILTYNGTNGFTWVATAPGTAHNLFSSTHGDTASVTPAQGDIIYYTGSSWTTLSAGTSGNYLKTQGAGANPTWDTPSGTVYTAGGTLLQLNTNTFSLKEGTLTDTKYCKYILGTGIVCDYDAGGVTYTATNGITLNTGTFELGGTLTKNTSIALAGFDLNLSGLGNVGIGTTTASYKLDVRGTAAAGQINAEAGLCINGVCKTTWTDSGIGSSVWATNGNDIYSSNTGNVGIGTTTPVSKLEIAGLATLTNIPTGTGVSQGALYINPSATGVHVGPLVQWAAKTSWNLPVSGHAAFADLDNDGDLDVMIGGIAYQNSGTANNPSWVPKSEWNAPINKSTDLADLDNDGDFDLLIGNSGTVTAYKNIGTIYAPVWERMIVWDVVEDGGDRIPDLVDLDNDGDLDMLVGGGAWGNSSAYKNVGDAENPSWVSWSAWAAPGGSNDNWGIALGDLDLDGDYDLLKRNYSGAIVAYQNTGDATNPIWTLEATWAPASGNAPTLADIDGDGDSDLFLGNTAYENTGSASNTNGNTLFGVAVAGSQKFRINGNGSIESSGNLSLINGYISMTYNGNLPALKIVQSGTGDIFNLYDGTNKIFTAVDGGNIGIGTTTPLYKLEVNGSAKVSSLNINGAYSLPTAAGTTSEYLRGDGTWAAIAAGMSGSGTTNYLSKFTGASSLGNSLLFDNGTAVGIGTETLAGARFKVALDSTYSNITDPYTDETKIASIGGGEVTGGRLQIAVNPWVCGTGAVSDADGNNYNTVHVNNQCWMAPNLRVGTKLASASDQPTNNGIIEKWCYDNSDANCATDGGLYKWNEAMQYSAIEGAQGICPADWHIPTDAEQYALENYLKDDGQTCNASRFRDWDCAGAGTKLKPGGTSGMNIPLAGHIYNGNFENRGSYGYIWSSYGNGTDANGRYLYSGETRVYKFGYSKENVYSVRCIKNTESFDSFYSSTSTSINLLSSSPAFSINNFHYNIATLPATSSIRIQFSKDNTNWYSAAGTLSAWTTISTTGGADIDLTDFVSASSWTNGNAFYYKLEINPTTDYTQTPTIDDIRLDYVPLSGSGGLVFDNSGNFGVGTFSPTAKLSIAGSGISTGQLANFTNGNATSVFNILDNGNVGIGSTAPSYKLDVQGSGAAGQINAEAGLCINGVCKTSWSDAGIGTDLWAQAGNDISYTTGNVGIGTTATNNFKLQVAGNIGPNADNLYNLGSQANRFNSIHLGPDNGLRLDNVYTDASNYEQGYLGYEGAAGTDSSLSFDTATESNFSQEDLAYNTTLTPSATTGNITLTLGTGNWNDNSKITIGTRVKGNGGIATITSAPAAQTTITANVDTAFTNTNAIASGSWNLFGTNFASNMAKLSGYQNGNDSYVKLLLHADGSGNSFSDSSPSVNVITTYGDATQSTTQSKFGGKSAYFSGAGGYLTTPYNSNLFDWWSADSSIDAWVYLPSYNSSAPNTNSPMIGHMSPTDGTNNWSFGPNENGKLRLYYYSNSSNAVTSSQTIPLNTWTHIAMTYSGTTIRLFINGIQDGSASIAGTPQGDANPLIIGQYSGVKFAGYIDEFRISSGIARWTSNFTPPAAPYGIGYPANTCYTLSTTNTNRYNTSVWTGISSASLTETLSGQNINYSASFDGRTTFRIYDSTSGNSGWRPIARNNGGTWQYNSNATAGATNVTWTNSTTNNQNSSISQAVAISANQMTGTQFQAVNSSAWSGGFTPGTLDFAMSFKTTDSTQNPTLDQITINYLGGAGAGILTLGTKAIGSGTVRDLQIKAGDNNQLYLSSNGNIGIGMNTPTEKLMIAGNIAPSVDNTYDLGSATNRWRDLYLGPASIHLGDQTLSNSGGSLIWNGQNVVSSTGAAIFSSANINSGALYVDSVTGNVGIGTTSPTAYLNIKAGSASAGTAPLKFTTGTLLSATEGGAMEFDGSHIYFTATNAGTRYQLDQQSGTAYTATNGLTLNTTAFELGGTLTKNTELALGGFNLNFSGTGNIGIGTTSPQAKLHVAGATSIFGSGEGGTPADITIRGAAAGGADIAGANMYFDASNGTGSGGSGSLIFRTAPTLGGPITFDAVSSGSASSGSSVSWSHTTGTGSNRMILVGVYAQWGYAVTGIKYGVSSCDSTGGVGGTAMTAINSLLASGDRVSMYYLVAPASGSNLICVGFGSNTPPLMKTISQSYSNVNPTLGTQTSHTGLFDDDVFSTTISSAVGNLVVDVDGAANAHTLTADGSQTQRVAPTTFIGMSEKAGASSVTMTWQASGFYAATAHMLVSLQPLTGSSANLMAERLRIDNVGNIGIGTTTPLYKLEVNGSAKVSSLNINGAYSLPAAAGTTSE
ncbi:MAG: FISUMP domain-containing protein, partial [Candidatus Moraniibacteriota bacterium]